MATTWVVLVVLASLCLAGTKGQSTCSTIQNVGYDATGDLLVLYNLPTAGDCCNACSQFEDCQYFSWVSDSTKPTFKQCTLKSPTSKQVASTTTQGGRVTRVVARKTTGLACSNFAATDYNNGFLSKVSNVDVGACCANCTNYPGCNYYVHVTSSKDCYLKGYCTNQLANSGTTAGSVLPATTPPLRTGKIGVAWFNSMSCTDLKNLNVAWIYNWMPYPDAALLQCILELGLEYIPMQRASPLVLSQIYTKSKYLLTFNEPNFSSQSNLSPAAAAALWPQLQAFAQQNNMKISSPSAAAGGDLMDPIAWLDQFFAACTNCQVDFITTHIYTCSPIGVANFLATFKKYNKPIWLTEFACPSAGSTVAAAASFMNQTIPLLEADSAFARYAWFGTRIAPGDTWLGSQVNLYDSASSALSLVGNVYNSFGPKSGTSSTSAKTSTSSTGSAVSSTTSGKATSTTTTGGSTSTSVSVSTSTSTSTTTTGSVTQPPLPYLGCYIDSATRDLSGATISSSSANTIDKCRYFCGERVFQYSALQYGIECACGNSYGSQGKAASSSECYIACSGSASQICGGNYRNSIYNSSQVGYLGCYVDGFPNTRDMPFSPTITGNLTIQVCRAACSSAGYLYSGMQYASQCFCGNKYGTLGSAPDSECNMLCSGDSSARCGAGNRNSVYTAQPNSLYKGY